VLKADGRAFLGTGALSGRDQASPVTLAIGARSPRWLGYSRPLLHVS
jgi:hypothetical protein